MNPIKEWDSIKEASIALNINMQSISANCLEKIKQLVDLNGYLNKLL